MRLDTYNWGPTGMRLSPHQPFGVTQYVRAPEAEARIEQLESAMRTFVERCEKGEILSKKTYAQFKELLG